MRVHMNLSKAHRFKPSHLRCLSYLHAFKSGISIVFLTVPNLTGSILHSSIIEGKTDILAADAFIPSCTDILAIKFLSAFESS